MRRDDTNVGIKTADFCERIVLFGLVTRDGTLVWWIRRRGGLPKKQRPQLER